MLTLEMSGFDRTYQPPRDLRGMLVEGNSARRMSDITAWDLFTLQDSEKAGAWASNTLDAVLAAIDSEHAEKRGCTDCSDTGFYGIPDAGNPDLLVGMLRRVGNEEHEQLAADGEWKPYPAVAAAGEARPSVEILSLEMAGDLADALLSGHTGLLRKYSLPRAFLPPTQVVAASLSAELISARAADNPRGEWVNYAAVDDDDPGAVWTMVRASGSDVEYIVGDTWVAGPVPDDWHLVELDDELAGLVSAALLADAPLTVSPNPKAERLRRYWSSGKGAAKIRWGTPSDWKRCYRQLVKYMGLRAKGYCQNLHKRNTGVWTGDRRNVGRRGSAAIEENLLAAIQAGAMTAEGTTMADTETLADGEYAEIVDNVELLRSLAASAFPVSPPDEWFSDPKLSGPTPLTVDDNGRVYGHIATFDIPHIGLPRHTTAPKSSPGYPFFRTGQLITASGKRVNVGQLTLAGGHASMQATAEQAVRHYDDTGSGFADVAAGEDRYGIWVAGGLRPTVTPEQLRVVRASAPSGDWRSINGRLELVAVCQVNVPGFPVARAMAASGAITSLVAAGARPLAVQRASMIADASVLERVTQLEEIVNSLRPVEETVVADAAVVEETVIVPDIANTPAPTESVAEVAPIVEVEAPVAESEASEPEAPAEDNPAATEDSPAVTEEPVVREPEEPAEKPKAVVPITDPPASDERIQAARKLVVDLKRDLLRRRVHGNTAQAPETVAADGGKFVPFTKKGESERKGGGFPISDVKSLKDAISAYGRSNPEDRAKTRAHIISMARKLKRTDLIPEKWLTS